MMKSTGRREFVRLGRTALVTLGLSSQAPKARAAQRAGEPLEGDDYYDKLGVTKIIHAAGTYTALTASTMPAAVQAEEADGILSQTPRDFPKACQSTRRTGDRVDQLYSAQPV
jgi:hypothetical protein